MFRLLRFRRKGFTIYTAVIVHTVGTVARHRGHFKWGVFELLSQQVKAITAHTLHCERKLNSLSPSSSYLTLIRL